MPTAARFAQTHPHPPAGGFAGVPAAANPKSSPKLYNSRHPERTLLYQTIAEHFETWHELASAGQFDGQGDHHTPKPYVRQAFRKYLECGIFAHGFARARCADCAHDYFVAFSCKGRSVCPEAAALLHAARWGGAEQGAIRKRFCAQNPCHTSPHEVEFPIRFMQSSQNGWYSTGMAPTLVRDGQFCLFFFSREETRFYVHVAHACGEARPYKSF